MNVGLPVNTSVAEAAPALSRDGHWLFFHRTTLAGDFDLMASWRQYTHDDFGWQEPVNLAPVVNSAANDAGAAYFAGDENSSPELFFGSTRFGGFDLFVSRLSSNGTFGPATLIPELSSAAGDQRPTISHDGKEIFFHSNRSGSIAGTNDIWTSTRPTLFDPWEPPTNVSELNTAFADAQPTLSSDGDTLIFNSNRPGGFGANDLYVVTRTKLRGKSLGGNR
jgi:Tol biopolymer transport system component